MANLARETGLRKAALCVSGDHPPPERQRGGIGLVLEHFPFPGEPAEQQLDGAGTDTTPPRGLDDEELGEPVIGRVAAAEARWPRYERETDRGAALQDHERMRAGIGEPAREELALAGSPVERREDAALGTGKV